MAFIATEVSFQKNTDFRLELSKRIDRYFETSGLERRDHPKMYQKTAVIIAWLIASYVLLVLWAPSIVPALILSLSLSLSMAGSGFCIQHDGNHRGYSKRTWINRLAAFSLDALGGSSYMWHWKHNVRHHCYTNIVGVDADIDVGGLCRLAPQQRHLWPHRFQHLYMWFFYGLISIKWHLWDDFHALATGRLDHQLYPRPKGTALLTLIAGKAIFVCLALVIPLYFHPLWMVASFYVLVSFVLGMTLTVVFVLAHCVSEAAFASAGPIESEWSVHQIETTVDFARDNRLLNWYLGGLNLQVEHHLFPNICHVHYRAMSDIVEAVCREYGVRYKTHKSMLSALASHYRWLREMGRRPERYPTLRTEVPG